MNNTPKYRSPDGKHKLSFILEGDIRFGPSYYILELNGKPIKNRIFGFVNLWHPESKYLALQEWLTTDYQEGPITSLTIVDLKEMRISKISTIRKGFISPINFEEDVIIYEKAYSFGQKGEFEMDLRTVMNWKKII
ncbi:hypothetical protein [Algoriphagus sp.]|uniref:hypothetical protein n=1 Tax=Algoriphagus sp. TaxID=1872435 RepID=UPI00271C2107|nr:hypothetical protein [Algoriphagus sp.]MDO8965296.1 hypothetical protein [Algoriphagus sp.]MDP3198728.1 hypothetical protein [Algoriphagus sp.]